MTHYQQEFCSLFIVLLLQYNFIVSVYMIISTYKQLIRVQSIDFFFNIFYKMIDYYISRLYLTLYVKIFVKDLKKQDIRIIKCMKIMRI